MSMTEKLNVIYEVEKEIIIEEQSGNEDVCNMLLANLEMNYYRYMYWTENEELSLDVLYGEIDEYHETLIKNGENICLALEDIDEDSAEYKVAEAICVTLTKKYYDMFVDSMKQLILNV